LPPFLLGLAHGRQRVGGLARLRDGDEQVPLADQRVAVAELGAEVDLDGDARDPLDEEFAHQGRVPGGAAGHQVELLQALGVDGDVLERDAGLLELQAAAQGVGDGGGCSWISLSMKCL